MANALDVYIGFDSAWTDKASAPGAICALEVRGGRAVRFHPPRLARFSEALAFVEAVKSPDGCTLVAVDQPTMVPNLTSLRPVERTAAGLVSWLGGGVQPSNRGRVGMFCDASPIWPFLAALGATEQPEECRTATAGLFLVEVFPALALASIEPSFFGRLAAPRYNPERRKTFKLDDWKRVATGAAASFAAMGFAEASAWCAEQASLDKPRKADQDRLDAMLCLLIGLGWRLRPREGGVILGLGRKAVSLPGAPWRRNLTTPLGHCRANARNVRNITDLALPVDTFGHLIAMVVGGGAAPRRRAFRSAVANGPV